MSSGSVLKIDLAFQSLSILQRCWLSSHLVCFFREEKNYVFFLVCFLREKLTCPLFSSPDVPSEPKNARVTKVNKDCIFVAWDRPDSDGGSPITGYLIERKERNSLLWVKANDTPVRSTEYPCVGLIEGLEYSFRIYALNKAGSSPPSKPTEYVTARMPVGEFWGFFLSITGAHLNLRISEDYCFHSGMCSGG